ncbi:hypothetical protein NUW58_g5209 [Xylaria curta]|uniref:Uncharacterized protein n=1 Tax=Xylaria curta TaxID=42375 RepID=A0ACC1P584_9PEZI|nr:hypothetical protein NUW58_g5209 [Xylaria curta]
MPLKRGLERESCDFCFRRKIKCDRSLRSAAGHPACSQCDLRQTPCTFESDDARTQRRRKTSAKGSPSASTQIGTKARRQISHDIVSNDRCTHSSASVLKYGNDVLSPPFLDGTTASSRLPLDIATDTTTWSPMTQHLLPTSSNLDFQLSPNDVSFLDSILQTHDVAEPSADWGDMPSPGLQTTGNLQDNLVAIKTPYNILGIQPETLDAAIEAYFSFASLALPVLSKDGFIADYNNHWCSPSLVFAVACRGCPFIHSTEKWALQQRLASQFRETFLQARSLASSENVIRLDDLEALVLMVDFEYENSEGFASPLQSQLQNLLLTHDSLVAMTLQYRIETRLTVETGAPDTLSRATERQTLLFWYLYGLDAFYSLDRKVASRIQDGDIDLSTQPDGLESQSYFNAIISLAGIAREMARRLCGSVTRRKGVKCQDIESLYNQLEEWQRTICPPALKIQSSSHDSSPGEMTLFPSTGIQEFLPLQKVVVMLLELNCFMQLEACVSQYGIEEHGSFVGQIMSLRVKYETLQAAYKIVEVARWVGKLTIGVKTPDATISYAMTDLAPGIIRNIFAGASTWISLRARENFHSITHGELEPIVSRSSCAFDREDKLGLSKEQAKSWTVSLTTLRDIVSTATSHRDTELLIKRLNRQLETLNELV